MGFLIGVSVDCFSKAVFGCLTNSDNVNSTVEPIVVLIVRIVLIIRTTLIVLIVLIVWSF